MNETIATRGRPAAELAVGDGHVGAVSWGAIFAGAAGSAALSLILLLLGTGLGMSSVSPWSREGVSGTAFGIGTILWLTLTAIFASALGGYIAGRLRSRWTAAHVDEIYFRDTAHGFLAWAVATLVTAGVLTSVIGGIVGTGIEAGASTAGAVAAAGGGAAAAAGKAAADDGKGGGINLGYFTDALFRKDASAAGGSPSPDAGGASPSASEVTSIVTQSLKNGSMSPEDTRYVAQLVAQRTGLSPQDAEKRVTDVFARTQQAITEAGNKAKETADKARKATAYGSLWLFVSLLIGAFSASFAATRGGRRRDLSS